MKKLLLSCVVAAFGLAAYAGNDGACSEKAGSCCAAAKASTEAKAECPMAKTKQAKTVKSVRQASAKQVLKSPKANG